MESLHLVWSATSCTYPGAALYIGLARHAEIASLCGWRSKRQMAVYNGAHVRALGQRTLPTFYLAIRDPSSIRVKLVDQPKPKNTVRYVNLIFERDRIVPATEAAAILQAGTADAAFVITVSLPIAKEEQFGRDIMPKDGEEWTDLFERLTSMDSGD